MTRHQTFTNGTGFVNSFSGSAISNSRGLIAPRWVLASRWGNHLRRSKSRHPYVVDVLRELVRRPFVLTIEYRTEGCERCLMVCAMIFRQWACLWTELVRGNGICFADAKLKYTCEKTSQFWKSLTLLYDAFSLLCLAHIICNKTSRYYMVILQTVPLKLLYWHFSHIY